MSDGRPDPGSSRDAYPGGQLLSGADMAELWGERIPAKTELILKDGRLFHREGDGSWWEYRALSAPVA